PRKSRKKMKNPVGIPTILAISVEKKLTFKDTQTMFTSSGSSDQMSKHAESKLSKRNAIVLGQ
ncbi:MAG: hypothetical protein ACM3MN_01570, partial [Nitrospirota bacterium]